MNPALHIPVLYTVMPLSVYPSLESATHVQAFSVQALWKKTGNLSELLEDVLFLDLLFPR